MKRLEVDHPMTVLAPAFVVSRSGYYRWRRPKAGVRAAEDARLKSAIKTIHDKSRGTYGRPCLVAALRHGGVCTSGRRVARLLRELGLRARRKGGWRHTTTQSRHRLVRWPNRLRELAATPSRPGVAWVSDMTYVRPRDGWLYVAAVLDIASRRLLGLAMAPPGAKHEPPRPLHRQRPHGKLLGHHEKRTTGWPRPGIAPANPNRHLRIRRGLLTASGSTAPSVTNPLWTSNKTSTTPKTQSLPNPLSAFSRQVQQLGNAEQNPMLFLFSPLPSLSAVLCAKP
jgi:hypothetical protein